MVPPGRIELPASPLPRVRSATELRRRHSKMFIGIKRILQDLKVIFMTTKPKKDLKQLKEERLAAALRANLRKRKDQARQRASQDEAVAPLTEEVSAPIIELAQVPEDGIGPQKA